MERLSEVDRRWQMRQLGLKAFLKVDSQKREEIGGIEFEVPSSLGDFTEEDGRAVVNAIHGLRFAGEEDTKKAQEAAHNYFVTVLQTTEGKTIVTFSFSPEAWEQKKREIEEGIYKRFLIRQLPFTSS